MTGFARRHRYSYTEYLVLEESSSVRHEFHDGDGLEDTDTEKRS